MGTYENYVEQYRQYHASQGPGRTSGYSGRSMLKQMESIRAFARSVNASSALDYGCGRGEQYSWRDIQTKSGVVPSLQEFFGLNSVSLFDPAVPERSTRPQGSFDLVMCTDVLEHVHENDVPFVLRDIISFADKGAFLSIAKYKAGTILPNGENAHVTIRNFKWWQARIEEARSSKPNLPVQLVLKHKIRIAGKLKLKWEKTARI